MLLILNPDYRDHANAFIKGIIKKRSTHALKFIKFNEGIKKRHPPPPIPLSGSKQDKVVQISHIIII